MATGDDANRTANAVYTAMIGIDSNTTDLEYWETISVQKLLEKGTTITIDPKRQWKKYFDFK